MPSVTLHAQATAAPPFRHLDEPSQKRIRQLEAPTSPAQSLRRTGQRPYAFNGAVVATICGVTPALPYWYELNVYRTVLNGYVADIRLFNKDPDRPDLFRVSEHDDLDAATAFLENYDPSADLAPVDVLDPTMSAAARSLRAARLQTDVDRITRHYRALVGDLLYALHPRAE